MFAVLAALVVAAAPAGAGAQVIGAYFGSTTQRTDGGKVVGVSFNSHGQTITSLGFYDFGSDGLAASYQVGLWDSSQNLIASTTITPTSNLFNEFRYEPITPVTLGSFANPQTFMIGALLPDAMADVWLDNAIVVLGVGFTGAGTGQFSPPTNTLIYPATLDASPYVVVNANGPVPEPGCVAALGALGLLIARRRRRVLS
jgi:hypothetical protein